jgi:Uma2 family endonuclease
MSTATQSVTPREFATLPDADRFELIRGAVVERDPLRHPREADPSETVTADAFAKIMDTDRYELVRGKLSERTMGTLSSWIGFELAVILREYCRRSGDYITFGDGAGFDLSLGGEKTVRKPDAAVVSRARLIDGVFPEPWFQGAPELAVEVVSPNDLAYDVDAKVRDYLAAGSAQVWVVRPILRTIDVYRPNGAPKSFGPDDELTAEPLLPGCRWKVADVFPPSA